MINLHAHTDWNGYHRALTQSWVLHGDPRDPEHHLRAEHLRALAQLAQRHRPGIAIGFTLTPDRLFDALHDAVELGTSVVYDLRELLDFLLLLDVEAPPYCFDGLCLDHYAARVEQALQLAALTFSWRVARGQPRRRFLHAS